MAVVSVEPLLERRRMSREEFDSLPREVRAEYVHGVALMSPPAVHRHQFAAARLVRVLADALPELFVAHETGLDLGDSLRIPDVAAFTEVGEEEWGTTAPVLVVEVLSRTTRSEDLLRKPEEYRRAGIGFYWILDRLAPSLTALESGPDGWDVVLELDTDNPTGAVQVGEHGTVDLDLATLV